MAGMQSNNSDDMITGINVTPLVDVVLVLLVIFMITAPAIYQSALKVELPKAVSGEKTEHVTLRFSVSKDGRISLDNEIITAEQITDIVKKAIEKDPSANAIVSADSSVQHGAVVGVIDLVKVGGINKISIGVDSSEVKKQK